MIPQPTPTAPYVTPDYLSQSSYRYTVTDQSNILSGSMSFNTVEGVSRELSTPEMKSSHIGQVLTELSTPAQQTHMITELSTLEMPSVHLISTPVDTTSTFSTSASLNTVHGNSTVTDNGDSGTSSGNTCIMMIYNYIDGSRGLGIISEERAYN